ncbi:DNA binding protein [Bacillus phage TsarBomba]|uniref:BZIP domain-containing protein n=1 Tax=Bacillus phage TsarBomba TaxID=1690456 RepID=A0A0K2D0L6_9CAUD|nr:DNA binding protein [Bacillus phage TsarBomba]ALA13212.1 hypothetical protein TSARBOMBA_179 [Bacillus phage TsarBomba]
MEGTKYCPRCKKDKPINEFGKRKSKSKKGGYIPRSNCKLCDNERVRIYKRETKERLKEHRTNVQRRWCRTNPDKVSTYQNKYFSTEKGKEKNREAQRRFREKRKMKMTNQKQNVDELSVFQPTLSGMTFEELVTADYKNGVKQQDILDKYVISTTQLYDILNRNQIPLRNRMRSSKSNDRLMTITKMEMETFEYDYKQGMHLEKLYKKYGLNKHGLYKLVDKLGLPRRNKKIKGKQQLVFDLAQEELVDPIESVKCTLENGELHVKVTLRVQHTGIDSINLEIKPPKEEK